MRLRDEQSMIRSLPERRARANVDLDTDGSKAGMKVLPEDDRLVYSVAEAAARLGISRAFAYELVARGELPVICLGRRRLVPKIALEALLAATESQ